MADREPGRDTDRRRTTGGRRAKSVRRPRDGRPARPVSPGRTARSRTVRAAATFGISTTRRAAVFAIVFCALALSVAVPLRTYLGQRDDVARQEQLQAELRAEVDALEARKAELDDPAQVEAEARERLRYVMPGETPYIVELPEGNTGGDEEPERGKVKDESWYQLLWNAVSEE
ncbi:FtsB family cell division protein [Actinophytocola glycyrrhizae]|uniref:Septum formation initiator family protein n=1 Tax=Actinophytocola glycyrrhizae TaxID=2044873 RepID=A0ABV9S0H0_9PSEU